MSARQGRIARMASEPSFERPQKCATARCERLTSRSQGNGVSASHCKRCVERARRHGSFWRRSYLVREIEPYRLAAQRWLTGKEAAPEVVRVISALDALIANSGRTETANAVRWAAPEEKARIALARLRESGKTGRQLLLIVLTVKATMEATGPRANREFLLVQVAKQAHRLASGTHIRSAIYGHSVRYPRAEGILLRILGGRIEDIAAIVADGDAVEEVLGMVKPKSGRR